MLAQTLITSSWVRCHLVLCYCFRTIMWQDCFNKINVCFTPLTADAYTCPDGLPDCTSMSIMPKQVAVTSSIVDCVALKWRSLRSLTKSKLYYGTYLRKKWICHVKILDIAFELEIYFNVVFRKPRLFSRHFRHLVVFRPSCTFEGLFTTRLAKMADAQVCQRKRRGVFKSTF